MQNKLLTNAGPSATSNIKGISHITFVCKNLEKSLKMFKYIFNAQEIYSSDGVNFSISNEKFILIGDLWIALMQGEPVHKTYNHVAFKVEPQDLFLFREKIEDLELDVLPGRLRSPEEGESLYFYDYDNHLLELHTGKLHDRLKFYQNTALEENRETNSKVSASHIRAAIKMDIISMVEMSDIKRLSYEKAQNQFWRRALDANEQQEKWFREIIQKEDHILLVSEKNGKIEGFIIGKLIAAPEVYNPGGLVIMIDDFCVADDLLWESVGKSLLQEICTQAKSKGAVLKLIVCGHHDNPKKYFLNTQNLNMASEWYVGEIG